MIEEHCVSIPRKIGGHMSRKVYCRNSSCKHWCGNDTCDTTVKIGSGGRCESFEKGIIYYFHLVWEELSRKNYIDMVDIINKPDIRIGIYYVADCYNLGMSEMEWGTCRMVMLKTEEGGKPLTYDDIKDIEIDMGKLRKHITDFNNGILPGKKEEKEQPEEKEPKEFGWLSPTGEFTESPFGEHEESASLICEKRGFVDEYWKWVKETGDNEIGHLMRDFLAEVKGYCLIHNPSGYNGYIVTNIKNLTKRQRKFLYDYFMDMGDRFKAEQFLEEE